MSIIDQITDLMSDHERQGRRPSRVLLGNQEAQALQDELNGYTVRRHAEGRRMVLMLCAHGLSADYRDEDEKLVDIVNLKEPARLFDVSDVSVERVDQPSLLGVISDEP